jgi:hypothetical protein
MPRTKKPSIAKTPAKPDKKIQSLMQRHALIQKAFPQASEAHPFDDYLRYLGVEDVGEDLEAIARDIPEHFETALKHWGDALEQRVPVLVPSKAKQAMRVARLKEIIDRLDATSVEVLLAEANKQISRASIRSRLTRHVASDSAEWAAMWLAIEEEFGDVVQSNDGECWQYMGGPDLLGLNDFSRIRNKAEGYGAGTSVRMRSQQP